MYVYHGLFIKIHQDTLDTPSYKIRKHAGNMRETCGIQSEMHTSNVSREVRI